MTQLPAGLKCPTAQVASCAEVPAFAVTAMDQWGNPTQPCPEMPFNLVVTSEALEPSSSSFPFEPSATVTGAVQSQL